jgi:hypothetical protein
MTYDAWHIDRSENSHQFNLANCLPQISIKKLPEELPKKGLCKGLQSAPAVSERDVTSRTTLHNACSGAPVM